MENNELKERPFFFSNGAYQLFGVLHQPMSKKPKGIVVFCHPFAEEKLWSQRVYVDFARRLAAQGYAALRFDFMGHGDSGGKFKESSVASHLSDIRCAIDWMKNEYPEFSEVILVGLRFGASLAAIVAEESDDIARLILWDPTIDMNKFIQMVLRSNLTAQMAAHKKIVLNREQMIEKMEEGEPLNVEGYELSYDYYSQACDINLNKDDKNYAGPCLIVQIGKEGQPIKKELEVLQSKYEDADVRHVVEEQFWKEIKSFYEKAENLSAVTIEWLES